MVTVSPFYTFSRQAKLPALVWNTMLVLRLPVLFGWLSALLAIPDSGPQLVRV